MGCRRKTKTERELVADINKTFDKFCDKHEDCHVCDYRYIDDCKEHYVLDLLKKYKREGEL